MAASHMMYYVECEKGKTKIKLPIWGNSAGDDGNPSPDEDVRYDEALRVRDNLTNNGWVTAIRDEDGSIVDTRPPTVTSERVSKGHPHFSPAAMSSVDRQDDDRTSNKKVKA